MYPVLGHRTMILSGGCLGENGENDSIGAEDDSGYTANWLISSRGVRGNHQDDVMDDNQC
jgi:hypothetical protein